MGKTANFEFIFRQESGQWKYDLLLDGEKQTFPAHKLLAHVRSADPNLDSDQAQEEVTALVSGVFAAHMAKQGIALVADQLPQSMQSVLINRGLDFLDIQNASPGRLFDEALSWEGVIGYGDKFLTWAEAVLKIRDAGEPQLGSGV